MILTAGWRAYRAHLVGSRWIETTAYVEKCQLDTYHSFRRNGGGTAFSLRCRLEYDAGFRRYESNLYTTSDHSWQMREAIADWAAHHGRGSTLNVRVNPANPKEFVVTSELPIRQFLTASDAAMAAAIFGAGGLLLLVIGRMLRLPSAR
jgi:hypothetical protein